MIDVTKIVREITYNGTKIPLLGTGDNIIKVSTEVELNALLVPENVDKLVAYNETLYIIADNDGNIIAKPIAGKLLSIDSNGSIVAEVITYAEEASF